MTFKRLIFILFASIGLSFILYGNTIGGEFVYDDIFFAERPELRKVEHLSKLWLEPYLPYNDQGAAYRPVTVFTFALNFVLFGESPVSFHVTNIILNGIVVFLVYLIALQLFKSNLLAIFIALFYAILPIHVESIAFIKARDDILSTLFKLLGFLIFLKVIDREKVSYRFILVSSAIFYLGVLAKDTLIVLPLLFALIFWIRRKVEFFEFIKVGLLFVPGLLVYLFLRYLALGEKIFGRDYVYYIMDPLRDADFLTRIWTAFKIAFIYISKTFIPLDLSATYTYNHLTLVSNPLESLEAILGIVLLLLLIFLVIYRKTRGGPLGIGALIFLVSYSVYSKFFVQVSEIAAERWMYLPTVGLSMIAGFGIFKLYEYRKWAGIGLLFLLLLFYVPILIQRNTVWSSEESLYKSMVRDAPNSAFAHTNMTRLYFEAGNTREAIRELFKAQSIYKNHVPLLHLGALIAISQGNYDSAKKAIEKAIERRPDVLTSYEIYAFLLAKEGNCKDSLALLKRLKAPSLRKAAVRLTYAACYYKLGNLTEAKQYFDWDESMSEQEKLKSLSEF